MCNVYDVYIFHDIFICVCCIRVHCAICLLCIDMCTVYNVHVLVCVSIYYIICMSVIQIWECSYCELTLGFHSTPMVMTISCCTSLHSTLHIGL